MTSHILPPNPNIHYPAILETSCVFTFKGTEGWFMRVLTVNTTVNQDDLVSYPARSLQAAQLILFSPASTNCENQLEVLN